MKLAKNILRSIFKSDFYDQEFKGKLFISFKYFLTLALVLSIIQIIFININFFLIEKVQLKEWALNYSENIDTSSNIKITNGTVLTENNKVFFLPLTNEIRNLFKYSFDLSTYTYILKLNSNLDINTTTKDKDSIITIGNNNIEILSLPPITIPSSVSDVIIKSSDISNFIKDKYPYIFMLIELKLFLLYILKYFLFFAFLFLIAQIVRLISILLKRSWNFEESLVATIWVSMFGIIINSVINILNIFTNSIHHTQYFFTLMIVIITFVHLIILNMGRRNSINFLNDKKETYL